MAEPPADLASGNGAVKFAGAGFGTSISIAVGEQLKPRNASARELMRAGLPAVYRQGELAMPFVAALEQVLDPVVAVLDNLAHHFQHGQAPPDVLDVLIAWLGLEYEERLTLGERRALVANAATLIHRRGTREGLELALALTFPELPLRVEDSGGVRWSTELAEPERVGSAAFVVYCDKQISEPQQRAVARVIERMKPVNASYRLRVKMPRKAASAAPPAASDPGPPELPPAPEQPGEQL